MKRLNILLSAMVGLSLMVEAQNYTRDVDVIVELQPTVRAASRLDRVPRRVTTQFAPVTLGLSDTELDVSPTPMLGDVALLPPTPYYTPSPSRGYLIAGYFPAGDMAVQAGYRLVNSRTTRLEAWTSLDRVSFKGRTVTDDPDSRCRLTTTDFNVGLRLASNLKYGLLEGNTAFYLSHFNYPAHSMTVTGQNVNRYMLDLSWRSHGGEYQTGYKAGGKLERTGFEQLAFPSGSAYPVDDKRSLWGMSGNVGVEGQYMFTNQLGVSVGLDYKSSMVARRYLRDYYFNTYDHNGGIIESIVSVRGAFKFNLPSFNGSIGPLFDFGIQDASGTRTGVVGSIRWTPASYFTAYATSHAGTRLNSLGSLYERNRYNVPLTAGYSSFVKGDMEAGVSLGPWRGFSLGGGVGYSNVEDWVMPASVDGMKTFTTCDLSSLIYKACIEYRYARLVEFNATFMGVMDNSLKHSYYLWDDRARMALDVSATVSLPYSFTVEAGYELRTGRRVADIDSNYGYKPMALEQTSLGRINRGRVRLLYRIDSTWGVWARITGLGQGRYLTPGCVPGQRLGGHVGVTVNF